MVGQRDKDVDPRFDPLFQRGYDPAQHRTRVRSTPQPAAPRVEERAESARLEAAARAVPPSRLDSTETVPDGVVAGVSTPTAVAELEYEPPRRNPFRLILLLTSLAALGAAAALLWKRLADDPYGGYGAIGGDVSQVFFQQFVDALLGPLLTAGLLGMCLWLALGALRSRDRG